MTNLPQGLISPAGARRLAVKFMGMTMTIISNNLNTSKLQKSDAASNNPASRGDNAFSSILAMQTAVPAQNKPSSAPQNTAENSSTAGKADSKESITQSNQPSGKTENSRTATEHKTSTNDEPAQLDSLADKENTPVDAREPATSDNELNAAQIPDEALQANWLAEQAILGQGKLAAGLNTEPKGKPAFESTLLHQLIEPQRNLSTRLSGKNLANSEGDEKATLEALARFVKDTQAGSAQAKPETLFNTENSRLTASQQAALDKQAVAGPATSLNANKKVADHLRDALLGRLSPETDTANLADPRNINLKTSAQLQANQMMASDQAAEKLLESSVAAHSAAAASASVTNTQAQAPASPLIALGTSFYHPGWSQAMAQQVATQASLFFRQQVNGTHIAQMRLDPPELGPIKVSISIQDGVAQAAFVASNATVRQVLENSLADLHQALQEKGLSLGQAHVEQQDQQESFFTDDRNASNMLAQAEDSPADGLAESSKHAARPSPQHDGLINTFA